MKKDLNSTTKVVIIIEIVVVLYMIIALTKSEYNSYKIQQYIYNFEEQNLLLAAENDKLHEKYEYYVSPEYQEKIAKQNFGLVNPGEKVLVIPEKSVLSPEEEYVQTVIDERVQFYQNLSNPVKWWYYFFS